LNPFARSETVVASIITNFEMNNSTVRSLYDLMETDEEMALLMVKEQLNHYRIRMVSDEECKNLLHGGKLMNHKFLCCYCGPTNYRDFWVTN
jgi:hypothetical protein